MEKKRIMVRRKDWRGKRVSIDRDGEGEEPGVKVGESKSEKKDGGMNGRGRRGTEVAGWVRGGMMGVREGNGRGVGEGENRRRWQVGVSWGVRGRDSGGSGAKEIGVGGEVEC